MDLPNIILNAGWEGLFFALVALGVYITFRVLAFPDLSVDGTFPLGGAVVAVLIVNHNLNPFLATALAFGAGFCAGMITGFLNTKLRISGLLSGILMMSALWSINIRIMDKSNISISNERHVFDIAKDNLNLTGDELYLVVGLIVAFGTFLILNWFLRTDLGLALRATGDNEQMIRGLGTDTDKTVLLGCALSNGLVALTGAIFAQIWQFADVGMGFALIVQGLAMVIIGEAILRPKGIMRVLLACVVGAFLYRLMRNMAIQVDFIDIRASDINLITAALVILLLSFPHIKKRIRGEWIPPAERM